MAVISGKDGTATQDGVEVAELSAWTLTRTSNNPDYHTNDSGGSKKRVAGVKDCSGTLTFQDRPSLDPGDGIALVLYTNEDIFTGNVIIDDESEECDIEGGAIVGFKYNFSGNGTMTPSTGSAP